jgi:hypothetical protein
MLATYRMEAFVATSWSTTMVIISSSVIIVIYFLTVLSFISRRTIFVLLLCV